MMKKKDHDLSGQIFPKKLILIYNTMWDEPVEYPIDEIPDEFIISTDRSLMQQADAVLFHLPSLYKELEKDLEKPDGQLWIAWSMECEVNYPWTRHPEITKMFDLWMGYHQSDDIIHPYYDATFISSFREPVPFSNKQNKMCMFVSSSFNKSKRIDYLEELMRYTPIDSYGTVLNNRHITNDLGRETKLDIISKYKFTVAFENAIAPDYVTEKFFDPLLKGSVPVYMGAPNIIDFSPGENCFIDVRQFENPKALANFINSCYEDQSLYDLFFEWRKKDLLSSFIEKADQQRIHPIVRLCLKVREKLKEKNK